jgi:hypothetical protein
MITEKITVLKAEEGYTLTNGEAFGKVVYLGINDSADNWHEITDEEAEEIINEEMLENGEN